MPHKAPQNIHHFLNNMRRILRVKNDAALARKMDTSAPSISKLRHHHKRVTAAMLITLHDLSGLSIAQLRELLYATDTADTDTDID